MFAVCKMKLTGPVFITVVPFVNSGNEAFFMISFSKFLHYIIIDFKIIP